MRNINSKKTLTVISGIALLGGLFFGWVLGAELAAKIFYFISIFSGGYYVLLGAWRGLLRQRFLNIDFLVVIAAVGAIYINQLAEAAAVVFFFSLAEMFEAYGIERSRQAVEALVKKSPRSAVLKTGKKVPVEQVKINDVVVVKPGDMIPVDGVVVKGESSVDEATITGEPIPKTKRAGDTVFAGTINQQGYLEIKTSKTSRHSTFAKIIELVDKAQKSRAPAQEFIDRFAKYYTPSVVVAAILISVLPPVFFGGIFLDWLYRALVMLVIACPCALVISTPVSIASAIGGASRQGVLIKGGKYLELLGKVKAVAFDKTKTLTVGKPYVADIITFNGYSEAEILADAAGIEKFSSHPLAKSILALAEKKGIIPHNMERYENFSGQGGRANCLVCSDVPHCVGNLKLLQANNVLTDEVLQKTEEYERQGKTIVLVSCGDKVMGALAITDKIRAHARQTVKELDKSGVYSVIITGDNQHTAKFVAEKLGIKQSYASLLPEEKVRKVEELKNKFGYVAMVGDGVNDAPSLVTSSVGIAMAAGGSDVAIETADVALMNDNLLNIPRSIKLGQKTLKTIKQNIIAALGVKAVFLLLAVFGFVHLEFAIGADSGVAILVILNSLKLFHFNQV